MRETWVQLQTPAQPHALWGQIQPQKDLKSGARGEMNSIEKLDQHWNTTYSVARGYDEVVGTREEPEEAVL